MTTLATEDKKLREALAAAEERLNEAKFSARRERNGAGDDLLAPLIRNGFQTERADAETSARVLRDAADRGLLIQPVRTSEGWGIALTDPNIDAELEAAREAKREAAATLRAFESENADALNAERRKANAARVQAARDAGDFALARELEADEVVDARQASIDRAVRGEYADDGWEDEIKRSEPVPAGALTTSEMG